MNANTEDNFIHGISQQQSEVHGDKVMQKLLFLLIIIISYYYYYYYYFIIFTKALMSRKG